VGFRDFNGRQWKVLVVLMLVNFVNYVDRQIIFSLFPALRHDFNLSYAQLGELATAFTVVLSLGSLPLAMLADRFSRRAVIGAGVLFWSAATFLSGLAGSFRSLLVARGLVGVGEAAYTPAGAAILSGTFPKEVRARVQGAFDVGMFLGGAAGIALGGVVAEWLGWRPAFFLVGIPGLVLGLTAFHLPEPAHRVEEERVPIRDLLRIPAYLMILVSGWFSAFAGYAYVAWGPELVQDYKGFTPRESGLVLGITIVVAGMGGIMTGAALSDRLARVSSWGRAAIIPVGFLVSAPLTWFALEATRKVEFVVLFGVGTFFLAWYHGPTTATIHDLVPERARATALGLYYLLINLCSMALAPYVVGRLADRYTLVVALRAAVAAQVIGGLLFLGVIWLVRRETLPGREAQPLAAKAAVPGTEL
jgi:MFS transporter, Spinster family, sphingosine-1-phosphate transporter